MVIGTHVYQTRAPYVAYIDEFENMVKNINETFYPT